MMTKKMIVTVLKPISFTLVEEDKAKGSHFTKSSGIVIAKYPLRQKINDMMVDFELT